MMIFEVILLWFLTKSYIMQLISGINCQIDIDECEGDPCQNGATCVDGVDMYTCTCRPGYTGHNCEREIDECQEFTPCQNGARCRGEIHF